MLVLTAGVLVVLAMMGAVFFALMRGHMHAAVQYGDAVRAEFLARAGLQEAIARLRLAAYLKTEDPSDAWHQVDWLRGARRSGSFLYGDGRDNDANGIVDDEPGEIKKPYARTLANSVGSESDCYFLEVEDAASKINLNACDNLAVVLDNLCRLIGPPLVPADQDMLQPRRWYEESKGGLSAYGLNRADTADQPDLCYQPFTSAEAIGRPWTWSAFKAKYGAVAGKPPAGVSAEAAVFGDGYAIARYRARYGAFRALIEIKQALTYVERNGNGQPDHPLEQLEIELKYALLKPHLTISAWVDRTTVGVGKFEWVKENVPVTARVAFGSDGRDPSGPGWGVQTCQVLMDRDKSWIADDPVNDPLNRRGSLRGCYLSIINGHGAGQLRRIATNGADWVAVRAGERLGVPPGPISSYLIVAPEDAPLEGDYKKTGTRQSNSSFPKFLPPVGQVWLARTDAAGNLLDNPNIDYAHYPLCIHRAPVNINTASDKVLAALFMGLNVQHGHPLAVGTDASWSATEAAWRRASPFAAAPPTVLTLCGVKRVPVSPGKLVLDCDRPWPAAQDANLTYIGNCGALGPPAFEIAAPAYGAVPLNEAHELAFRVLMARQRTQPAGQLDPDPTTANDPASGDPTVFAGYERGPFKSWDDFYFRVVRPWDEIRMGAAGQRVPYSGIPAKSGKTKVSVARLIMANFNSNTDLLKFNPNIEWIDRWGRNFTEMERVMSYADGPLTQMPLTNSAGKSYPARTMRYKSSEMIDKSDLNRSTTEFSFDSNGIYELSCTGQVLASSRVLAQHKERMLVRIYDTWRESNQHQFVQGTISPATGAPGADASGQVTRDARNANTRLALTTLPEPLLPLSYRLKTYDGQAFDYLAPKAASGRMETRWKGYLEDLVGGICDAWGNPKSSALVPDSVANYIRPACYDGQIVLATNTRDFQPGTHEGRDSFLASFDGDLDTGTCLGNGREQAKVPANRNIRVMDTFGLLGLLNDTQVDFDPKDPRPATAKGWADYNQYGGDPFPALRPSAYWDNATCRMGDLRADGLFVGNCGVSVKDGGIKYLIAYDSKYDGTRNGVSKSDYGNWDPCWADRNTNQKIPAGSYYSLWFKPTWQQNDGLSHEFFNATSVGDSDGNREGFYIRTDGSNIYWFCENNWDRGRRHGLHGGQRNVTGGVPESPSFRTQPFRWSFFGFCHQSPRQGEAAKRMGQMGSDYNPKDSNRVWAGCWEARRNAVTNLENLLDRPTPEGVKRIVAAGGAGTYGGILRDTAGKLLYEGDAAYEMTTDGTNVAGDSGDALYPMGLGVYRCFMDTQRSPEGPQWLPKWHFTNMEETDFRAYSVANKSGPVSWQYYQLAAWDWQDGGYPLSAVGNRGGWLRAVFAINSVNYHNVTSKPLHTYRYSPIDGPMAVFDEIKMAKKWWNPRDPDSPIPRDQTTSRYCLPPKPQQRDQCPSFTSQTFWQSQNGFDAPPPAQEEAIPLSRVFWTVFTPRFMHENRNQALKRTEIAYGARQTVDFKGPFDFIQYNHDLLLQAKPTGEAAASKLNPFVSVDRPATADYLVRGVQPHATRGVEIQILDGSAPIAEVREDGALLADATFKNPDRLNTFGQPNAPRYVKPSQLRYRVIFRYPVDPLVVAGGGTVNPAQHYLLDTPVFDDLRITFLTPTRILDYGWEQE